MCSLSLIISIHDGLKNIFIFRSVLLSFNKGYTWTSLSGFGLDHIFKKYKNAWPNLRPDPFKIFKTWPEARLNWRLCGLISTQGSLDNTTRRPDNILKRHNNLGLWKVLLCWDLLCNVMRLLGAPQIPIYHYASITIFKGTKSP